MEVRDIPAVTGFRVLRELGRGGSAIVYEAVKADGTACALKIFHQAPDAEARRRILGEWKASMATGRLVRVQDFLELEGRAVLVMDYVAGPSLAELQARLPYVLPEVSVLVAAEILRSLEEIHGRGIIHRDLKPSNVLVNEKGDVLLTDFGLAKWNDASAHTLQGVILGSPEFMAPEQAQGDIVTESADLFAVTGLLYFLVTGTKPFSRPSPLATLAAVIKGEFEPAHRRNPKISPALSRILQKGLAPSPRDRFASAAAFREALEKYLVECGWPEDLTFAGWLQRPAENTMRSLRAMAEALAKKAERCLKAGDRDGAMETLSHLGLIAPDSLLLEELLARVEETRKKRAWWFWLWPAGGAVACVLLALLWWNGSRPEASEEVFGEAAETAAVSATALPVANASPAEFSTAAAPATTPEAEEKISVSASTPPPPAPTSPARASARTENLTLVKFQLPAGVEVEWNGISVPLDRPFRTRVGVHDVVFRKEGFPPLRRQVDVKPGEPTTIRVN